MKGKGKTGRAWGTEEERKKRQREDMETTSGSLSSLWGIKDEGAACGKGEEKRDVVWKEMQRKEKSGKMLLSSLRKC